MKRQKPLLTPRELEILALAMQGKNAREMGDALCVSWRTIQFHMRNVHGKLDTKTTMQAVREAVCRGLLPCWCQQTK